MQIEKLFELYEQKMYQLALRILKEPWDAEDAVIEAFTRILKAGYDLEPEDSDQTKRMIITITKSAAIDIYRKTPRRYNGADGSGDPGRVPIKRAVRRGSDPGGAAGSKPAGEIRKGTDVSFSKGQEHCPDGQTPEDQRGCCEQTSGTRYSDAAKEE